MKVIVLWENSAEQGLAMNLVAVLRKIGNMLVYGKVKNEGVQLEDWAGKPPLKLECVAGPSPSMPKVGDSIKLGDMMKNMNVFGVATGPGGGFSYEMQYDGVGYVAPQMTRGEPMPQPTIGITRELARELVKMFPDSKQAAIEAVKKKTKPVVPKPDTTETGVTVRDLDMWEEDDHADQTD